MKTTKRSISTFVALAALALTFSTRPLAAQDEESSDDPVELMRQIRRNMVKIEEELGKITPATAGRGEQVQSDILKLLEGMQRRQGQVVKDIDDMIKQLKLKDSSSGGGGGGGGKSGQKPSDSQQNGKNSKPRDRNKPDKPNGGQKKPSGKDQKKGGGQPEDNSGKEKDKGENTENQNLPPEGPREKIKQDLINQIWGNLPKELRQKLVDRNFDEVTPEYEGEVVEYFKKTNTPKKN